MTSKTINTRSQDGTRAFRFEVSRTSVALYINDVLHAEGRLGKLTPRQSGELHGAKWAIMHGSTNNTAPLANVLSQLVIDAQAELQAAFDQTPEGVMILLRRQRSEILHRRSACLDRRDAKMERAFATSVFSGPDYHARYEDIQGELDAFDAAHPEVIGAIKAERAAELADSFIGRNID